MRGLNEEAYYQIRLNLDDMEEVLQETKEWFLSHLPYGYQEGEKITGAALQQCGLVIPEALKEFQAWQIHIAEAL